MKTHHMYVLPLVLEAQVVLVPPSHQFYPVKKRTQEDKNK